FFVTADPKEPHTLLPLRFHERTLPEKPVTGALRQFASACRNAMPGAPYPVLQESSVRLEILPFRLQSLRRFVESAAARLTWSVPLIVNWPWQPWSTSTTAMGPPAASVFTWVTKSFMLDTDD